MFQLKKALLSKIAREKSVGSMNCELQQRGAKDLAATEAAHMKTKSIDLIKLLPSDSYIKHRKVAKLLAYWSLNDSKHKRNQKRLGCLKWNCQQFLWPEKVSLY